MSYGGGGVVFGLGRTCYWRFGISSIARLKFLSAVSDRISKTKSSRLVLCDLQQCFLVQLSYCAFGIFYELDKIQLAMRVVKAVYVLNSHPLKCTVSLAARIEMLGNSNRGRQLTNLAGCFYTPVLVECCSSRNILLPTSLKRYRSESLI